MRKRQGETILNLKYIRTNVISLSHILHILLISVMYNKSISFFCVFHIWRKIDLLL